MSTIDFVPYATQTGALVEAQATYVADPQTALGQQDGIADPANANKAWRQGTFVAAAWANVVSQALGIDVLDDGNLSNFITEIQQMLRIQAPPLPENFTAITATGAGNFTVPANTYFIQVELWGGGGGTPASHVGVASTGGGSGGYCLSVEAVTPGQVIPYVVGAGGVATAFGTTGGTGGTTSWNSTFSATGGGGGSSGTVGVAGSGSGAAVNLTGMAGLPFGTAAGEGGTGGMAPRGAGGGTSGNSTAEPGVQPGGGAGGPGGSAADPGQAGGAGAIFIHY